MKRIKIIVTSLLFAWVIAIPVKAQNNVPLEDSLGDGLYRIRFTNSYGCPSELQSFDPEFKEQDLQTLLSILYRSGGKDRGLMVEFPYQIILSGVQDKKQLIAEGEKKVAQFQSSLVGLTAFHVTSSVQPLKDTVVNYYKRKLEFEKIALAWLKSGNDAAFRKSVLNMHRDKYMESTLDKVLAIKDWREKFKYTYAEVDAILASRIYILDNILRTQNRIFRQNHLKVVTIDRCKL